MVFEDIFGELLEIFVEIFEDFWILFDALIRVVRVFRAIRAVTLGHSSWNIWSSQNLSLKSKFPHVAFPV